MTGEKHGDIVRIGGHEWRVEGLGGGNRAYVRTDGQGRFYFLGDGDGNLPEPGGTADLWVWPNEQAFEDSADPDATFAIPTFDPDAHLPPICEGCDDPHDPGAVKPYRGQFDDMNGNVGPVEIVGYCDGCAELARVNWSGNVKWIEGPLTADFGPPWQETEPLPGEPPFTGEG